MGLSPAATAGFRLVGWHIWCDWQPAAYPPAAATEHAIVAAGCAGRARVVDKRPQHAGPPGWRSASYAPSDPVKGASPCGRERAEARP